MSRLSERLSARSSRTIAPLTLSPFTRPTRIQQERLRLQARLKTDTYGMFYKDVFETVLRSDIGNVNRVIYKTLGEYGGRIVIYVFAYDTYDQQRFPINHLFYRSTGTSRSPGFEGMWLPMTGFTYDPLSAEQYRIGKIEDYYLANDGQRIDDYVMSGLKQHPDDDILAYGRYLRKNLTIVGGWLYEHWKAPPVVNQLSMDVLTSLTVNVDSRVLRLSFGRRMDLTTFIDLYLSDDDTYDAGEDELEVSFRTHEEMLMFYELTNLGDVITQNMLRIKEITFL